MPININWATNGIGLFQLAGAIVAPLLSLKLPIRVVIIGGQFCVAVLIFLVGYFAHEAMDFWLLICMYA